MANQYANRGFISINNQKFVDVKRIELKVNRNARAVNTMTPDGFNTGMVQGQYDIDLTFEIAVEDLLSSPKLETIDWSTVAGQLTAQFGTASDVWTITGLFLGDATTAAPAPGEEVSKTYAMKGLKIIDNVGNSSLFAALAS